MHKFAKITAAALLIFIGNTNCLASENVFYVLRQHTPDRMTPFANTLASLEKNYRRIDILIPQAYHINEQGQVGGEIEPAILNFAVSHHMKIMPLLTNASFSREIAKKFLADANAAKNAIDAVIDLCQKNHFYGIQLDFEMVNIEERDALTRFYEYAAKRLHESGFVVSFAVAPVVTDKAGESHFLDKIYTNWEGAYDLKRLGAAADFVSIMAYNQHGGITTPGPTASWEWTNQAVKYARQFIPANKISIGVPSFSTYWRAGTDNGELSGKMMVKMSAVSYTKAMDIMQRYHATSHWDKNAKISYAMFSNNWLFEYLFIEDSKSFAEKNALVKQYKLRGISVFDLGTEDPKIWDQIQP